MKSRPCQGKKRSSCFGKLEGYKPGGWRVRKDGKASNAKLRLDSGSVLAYKQAQVDAAKQWQERQ